MAKLEEELEDTMAALLGKNISVERQGSAGDIPDEAIFAYFVDEQEHGAGAFIADFAIGNYLGGALTKIPPAGAQESAENEEISGLAKKNLREVLNVCTHIMQQPRFDSVRLKEIEVFNEFAQLPEQLEEAIHNARQKIKCEVDVDGYGSGILRVFVH